MKIHVASDKTSQRRIRTIMKFLSNNQIFLDNLRVKIGIANQEETRKIWRKFMDDYNSLLWELVELSHSNEDKLGGKQ